MAYKAARYEVKDADSALPSSEVLDELVKSLAKGYRGLEECPSNIHKYRKDHVYNTVSKVLDLQDQYKLNNSACPADGKSLDEQISDLYISLTERSGLWATALAHAERLALTQS